jgi:hypothetical protein
MFVFAAHRPLLVCLALMIGMLCLQPRGPGSFALHDFASAHMPAIDEAAVVDEVQRDPSQPADTSLLAIPDLPDDTHAAVIWTWMSGAFPHRLVDAAMILRKGMRANTLLRPPSV